jgi:hypothetical protein
MGTKWGELNPSLFRVENREKFAIRKSQAVDSYRV